jgi:hypothetical protein
MSPLLICLNKKKLKRKENCRLILCPPLFLLFSDTKRPINFGSTTSMTRPSHHLLACSLLQCLSRVIEYSLCTLVRIAKYTQKVMYSRCNWLDYPFIVDVTLSFVPYRWLIISLAILNWAFYPLCVFF